MRILIVEDEIKLALSLRRGLEECGFTASVALDGTAAQRVLALGDVTLMLLDIGLPDMDGKELAQRLRQIPGMKDATLAALTGYGQAQDREATKAAGFDKHFVKPTDIEELTKWLSCIVA